MSEAHHGNHNKLTAEEQVALYRADLWHRIAEIEARSEKKMASETEEIYDTIGDALGWHNVTSDPDKVADVEILGVTAYNVDLLVMHHRIRDLLEANARWGGEMFEKIVKPSAGIEQEEEEESGQPEGVEAIYKKLAGHSSMQVELIGKYREYKKDSPLIDLRDMAQLLRIEEYNKYLGKDRFSTDDLRKRFFSNEPLVKMVTYKGMYEGKETEMVEAVDLRARCPKDNLKDFSFEQYIKLIKDEQVGFQRLGVTREDQLKGHHAENGSHTMFVKTGRLQPDGNPEYLWMPTCATTAAYDARTDLPKMGPGARAEGHPHEFGKYNEDTGTTVEVDVTMLTMHRGSVQLKDHNKTNDRMNHAAVGMNAKEKMIIKREQQIKTKAGRTFNGTVAVIGGERKGKIYKGLHKTYDTAMEKTRGYKLTDQEADDLILTDIIAPWIYANSTDWLMCFANSTNNLNYSYQKAIAKNGEVWSDYGSKGGQNFCVAIPCKDADENGLKYFFDYNELIAYINGRIKNGDIQGINPESQVSSFEGLTDEEIQFALGERDTQEADEENPVDYLDAGQLGAMKGLVYELFGDEYQAVWQKFVDTDNADVSVEIGGKSAIFITYIEDRLQKQDFDQIQAITGATGEEGKKRFLEIIRRMTPRLQQGFLDYAKTGKELEKLESSSLPPKVVSQIGLQGYTVGDFTIAISKCWNFMENKPGFQAFKKDVGKVKEVAESKVLKKGARKMESEKARATEWGSVMVRVAKILVACKDEGVDKIDANARQIIQERAKDPYWLLKEAIIQLAKPELLKELEGN